MNNNQQFDNYIKDQFSTYLPDVHPRIWEKIAAEKDRRKPAGFLYTLLNNKNRLLFIGLLIALATGGTWYFITNPSTQVNSNTTAKQNILRTNVQPVLVNNELSEKNNPTTKTGITPASSELNTTAENKDLKDLNPSLSPGSTKINIYQASVFSGDVQNTLTDNKAISNKRKRGSSGILNINTSSPGLDEDEFEGQGSLLGRLTFDAQKISSARNKKNFLPYFRTNTFLPGCPSIEKNASGNKKYFEIYGAADYAFRSLSDTGNSEYLKKRKESTKFSSAFSAGIRYTRVFNNSMSVRAGVNYSQINEKFTFSQGNIVQVTYIIGSNGDTLGSFTTTGSRYKSTINKYRSIDVPIAVGYELGNGKIHANINAGVVVNIYSWQKGDVLDTAYQPVNITTGKNSSPYQFKTNAGVGFIGAVSVYYKLNDRLHLMAEPYFRYNFSPMNKDNITLKQKYQTAGLRLGIRFDLK